MYQVKCDSYPLLDMRDDELILVNPKVKVEVNTVGEASFTIHRNHPYYNKLQKLKSIFEVRDDFGVIFRGRMTDDTLDFDNGKAVDLEGLMAFFNDSIVRPYTFPDDFIDDAEYIAASKNGNVIEFFLKWLIDNHNSQVAEFQQFKLGTVTVSDPNNYVTRSDSNYSSTWDTLKSKLFDSSLGGYLCIRYEDDGNYIDYLSKFELTNTQTIEFGKNLLDIKTVTDASNTYTAIIPVGAESEVTAEDGTVSKIRLTISDIADGNITDDIIKTGDTLYSKQAVEAYGWIYAPVSETTWNDVTTTTQLLSHGTKYLAGEAILLSNTIEISAIDLHFSDEQIQSFRVYRNVLVKSIPHNHDSSYQLTKLDIDLLNPQSTKITVGNTQMSMTDQNNRQQSSSVQRIQETEKQIEENKTEVTELRNQLVLESTQIINTCNEIILGALESYVETSNYEEFKETVEAQLKIMSDEITINFTNTIEQINNVDGDLQAKFTELYKYISFTSDGITIGDGETGLTLSIDNDMISFAKNGQRFGWWDGVNFHTGNIMIDVNEKAQFGNFAYVPRSDGSLMFLKVR